MDASWQPDPTSRHQYRWWDGAGWTDSVADNGQTGLDPLSGSAAPATVIGGSPPVAATPTSYGTPSSSFPATAEGSPLRDYAPQPATTKAKSGKGKWIVLGVLVVAALAVGGFLVFGGDDGGGSSSGPGRTTYELTSKVRLATRELKMKKGDVLRIRVEPPRGMDTVSGVLLNKAAAQAEAGEGVKFFSEFYSDSGDESDFITDFFSDARDLFSDGLEGDLKRGYGYELDHDGSTGEPDTGYVVALGDVTYTLAVGSYDAKDNGKIVVIVERYKGDVLTDLDGFSDVVSDDPFFTDTEFFSDTGTYSP